MEECAIPPAIDPGKPSRPPPGRQWSVRSLAVRASGQPRRRPAPRTVGRRQTGCSEIGVLVSLTSHPRRRQDDFAGVRLDHATFHFHGVGVAPADVPASQPPPQRKRSPRIASPRAPLTIRSSFHHPAPQARRDTCHSTVIPLPNTSALAVQANSDRQATGGGDNRRLHTPDQLPLLPRSGRVQGVRGVHRASNVDPTLTTVHQ
jgi:hypothetical protein